MARLEKHVVDGEAGFGRVGGRLRVGRLQIAEGLGPRRERQGEQERRRHRPDHRHPLFLCHGIASRT
jgi:hypothetical protein